MKYETTTLNTKKALAASLKKIMNIKPLSKITVNEIVRECGVNRNTFYYHFNDIYDLLKWMLEMETVEILKNFDLLIDYEEAIRFVIDYIENNEHIINCAYDAIGRDEMKRFFCSDFTAISTSVIEAAEKKFSHILPSDYKQFLADFYTEAAAGMLINWIKNRTDRDREKMIRYLSDTFKKSLTGIFQNGDTSDVSASSCDKASHGDF